MTGVKAIEIIRSALGSAIPAVVITGDTSTEGLRETKESRLEVLHKPVLAEYFINYGQSFTGQSNAAGQKIVIMEFAKNGAPGQL